jgi:hypothetical protein
MKKVLAFSVAALFCIAVAALAGDEKKMGGKAMEAKVTKVDTAAKMMTVTDSAGKEATIYWNDATKVEGGELKEGATVHYKASEKDGKWWATWVHVGDMKKM